MSKISISVKNWPWRKKPHFWFWEKDIFNNIWRDEIVEGGISVQTGEYLICVRGRRKLNRVVCGIFSEEGTQIWLENLVSLHICLSDRCKKFYLILWDFHQLKFPRNIHKIFLYIPLVSNKFRGNDTDSSNNIHCIQNKMSKSSLAETANVRVIYWEFLNINIDTTILHNYHINLLLLHNNLRTSCLGTLIHNDLQ